MNVMNIKHYLSAAAALAMFAACSDYDPGMSNQVADLTDAEIDTIKAYTENFVERYGEMDPNHTWGFGEIGEEMETRASNPKSNNWITYDLGKVQGTQNGQLLWKDEEGNPTTQRYRDGVYERQPYYLYGGNDVVRDFTIPEGVKIPGFPVQNYYLSSEYNTESVGDPTKPVRYSETTNPQNRTGWYHCKFPNENIEHWFENKDAVISYMQGNNPTNTRYNEVIPIGDVAQCNTLTDAEVADVYAEFSKVWTGTNPKIDLKSYFVQQVWCGNAQYIPVVDGVNQDAITGSEHMDYLVAWGATAGDNEHFYNFNLSNYSNNNKGMMLIYDSNTKNFAYKNSYTTGDQVMWNHYRLVYLHGNYYVGFDFESVGEGDKDIPADHIYNDWIVKIIPGEGTITFDEEEPFEYEETVTKERVKRVSRRVMCEDLGETDDFDFNDVVFDVEYSQVQTGSITYKVTGVKKKSTGEVLSQTRVVKSESWGPKNGNNTWTGTVTLRASGGTLPIYIQNFNGDRFECHEKMGGTKISGTTLYHPINVSAGLAKDAVELPSISGLTSTNPDNIHIYVYNTNGTRAGRDITYPTKLALQQFGTNAAPQKICMPTDVRWLKERCQIERAYPHFRNWVEKERSDFGFGNEHDWTREEINEKYLY
jgi:hypothetical protein